MLSGSLPFAYKPQVSLFSPANPTIHPAPALQAKVLFFNLFSKLQENETDTYHLIPYP